MSVAFLAISCLVPQQHGHKAVGIHARSELFEPPMVKT